MSLSFVIASTNGILVAADRRVGSYIHPILVDPDKYSLCPEGLIFFDGNRKVTVSNALHNFVAFTYTGSGSIDLHSLIEDSIEEFPKKRLSVKEYADSVLKIYFKTPEKYRFGKAPFQADDSNNLYIAGYDQGSLKPFLYQLDLPHRPGPIPLLVNQTGAIISGEGKHLEAAEKLFKAKKIKSLENQINGNEMLGKPTDKERTKLSLINSSNIPWTGMFLTEMQEFAEVVVEHTVSEQKRLQERPVVGGGVDVIHLTRDHGVKKIKYEPYLPVGKRPVADTAYNYLVLRCGCGQEVKLQVDFELDNPLIKSLMRYPANEKYQCSKCKIVHGLKELRNIVQEIVNYYIIVDNKLPEPIED